MIKIKGFLETSFVDWPGKACAVLFLGGCNFRCPYCHNHPLVIEPGSLACLEFNDVRGRLRRYRKWLGGVCISGGEPTLQTGLARAISLLKDDGWAIKLDTNGSQPQVLQHLFADHLLDMISMDVKAPLERQKYERCAGTQVNLGAIEESIAMIKASGIDHEFRMTVLPLLHSETDIADWARHLGREAAGPPSRLKLQNFSPRSPLDSALAHEQPFSADIFKSLQGKIAMQ